MFGVLDELKVFAENYSKLCTIEADLSLVIQRKVKGFRSYYTVHFDIVLLFGMTELKAQIAWKENVSDDLQFDPTDIDEWLLGN